MTCNHTEQEKRHDRAPACPSCHPEPTPPADDVVERCARAMAPAFGLDFDLTHDGRRNEFRQAVRVVLEVAGFERLREDFANACDVGRRQERRAEAAEKALSVAKQELDRLEVRVSNLESNRDNFRARFEAEKDRISELESENERLRKVARDYSQIPSTAHYIALQEALNYAQPNQDSGQPADDAAFDRCVKEIGYQAAAERRHRETLAALFELVRLRSEWERLPQGETNRRQAFEQFEARVKEMAK